MRSVTIAGVFSVLLALGLPAAWAARAPIEASMVVTGTITVNKDGRVKAYTLDRQAKLPKGVVQLLQQDVPEFRFEAAALHAEPATTGMSVRVVADQVAGSRRATLRITGASFGCAARGVRARLAGPCPAAASVRYVQRKPPRYPLRALRAGVGGSVLLVIQVGRDGHVQQVGARQVNLFERTDDDVGYRAQLAGVSIAAARKWTFNPPTSGIEAARDDWFVRVPVVFEIMPRGESPRTLGEWHAYLPGPIHVFPWERASSTGPVSADALAGSEPFLPDPRFVLETQLDGVHS